MKTRCKFYVSKISHTGWQGMQPGPGQETVEMQAAYGGLSPEDQSFAESTPSGSLSITVTNPAVVGIFKLGQPCYIDITPIEE